MFPSSVFRSGARSIRDFRYLEAWHTRYGLFSPKIKVLDSQYSSFEYELYRYKYNSYSKVELCESNTLNFWRKQSVSGARQQAGALCPLYESSYLKICNSDTRLKQTSISEKNALGFNNGFNSTVT